MRFVIAGCNPAYLTNACTAFTMGAIPRFSEHDVFSDFYDTEFPPQSGTLFADLVFQKCSLQSCPFFPGSV
jgi:hypothetical protein